METSNVRTNLTMSNTS